ncbi:MAG: fumarylacetoacetate hydrolase family protein [Hyphomicrobiales bacterium]|nr:fumarylacetoacetate hydrolase family protein [Hyphomicrobiales bacterium]
MRLLSIIGALLGLSYLALFAALQAPMVTATQPLEADLPGTILAAPDEALTFARTQIAGKPHLLLVTGWKEDGVMALDLTKVALTPLENGFAALDHFGRGALIEMIPILADKVQFFSQSALLPVAEGPRHISFGTNFADHGAEVNNEMPFHFPRLVKPTASVTSIAIDPDAQMIDYEVEICMSFDRKIASLEDFDAAREQLFLCGDFTDRKIMLQGMPEDEDRLSGIAFTDAKSLPGFFPTGPYAVIPRDWRSFVAQEALATTLNDRPMQWTMGGQMILDFRDMTKAALASGERKKWTSKGDPVALLPTNPIEPGQVLLSGTTEGVLFRPPSQRVIITLGAKYGMLGGFLSGKSGYRYVLDEIIQRTIDRKIMLVPRDIVVHHSSRLGTIRTHFTT